MPVAVAQHVTDREVLAGEVLFAALLVIVFVVVAGLSHCDHLVRWLCVLGERVLRVPGRVPHSHVLAVIRISDVRVSIFIAAGLVVAAGALRQFDGDRAAVTPRALSEMHDDLIDAYREITSALFVVERAMEATGDPTETPKDITTARADDISDAYDEPAKTLALMLLELNKHEYLWGKPETIGAENIREDGLTSIQQRHLDALIGDDNDSPWSDSDTE